MRHKDRLEAIERIISVIRLGEDLSDSGDWARTGKICGVRLTIMGPSRGSDRRYRIWVSGRMFIITGSEYMGFKEYQWEELMTDMVKTLERVVKTREKGRPSTIKVKENI